MPYCYAIGPPDVNLMLLLLCVIQVELSSTHIDSQKVSFVEVFGQWYSVRRKLLSRAWFEILWFATIILLIDIKSVAKRRFDPSRELTIWLDGVSVRRIREVTYWRNPPIWLLNRALLSGPSTIGPVTLLSCAAPVLIGRTSSAADSGSSTDLRSSAFSLWLSSWFASSPLRSTSTTEETLLAETPAKSRF